MDGSYAILISNIVEASGTFSCWKVSKWLVTNKQNFWICSCNIHLSEKKYDWNNANNEKQFNSYSYIHELWDLYDACNVLPFGFRIGMS